MPTLMLLGTYIILAVAFIAGTFVVGIVADQYKIPSAVMFVGGCGLSLWSAWPIALWLTKGSDAAPSSAGKS